MAELKKLWFAVASLLLTATPIYAQNISLQSSAQKVALLELYSSEGCASCPPADEWIAQYQNHPDLWKKFIPIVFHVTYWDRLGWKDPFASPEFDARQRRYADIWNAPNVATPAVVFNSQAWDDAADAKKIPFPSPKEVGILSAKALDDREYLISFKSLISISKKLEVHGALLGFSVSSDIHAGENWGKTLTHHFVVLNYRKKEMSPQESSFTTSIIFSSVTKFKSARNAVVFWVSEKENPAALQAVGGWLSS